LDSLVIYNASLLMTQDLRALTNEELDAVSGGEDTQVWDRLVRSMWATNAAVLDVIDAAKASAKPCH
jgi:hypothetical protein